jgi:hypothetical protein
MSEDRRACSHTGCTSMFDLIPPADNDYSIPKLKATKKDFVLRWYKCRKGHRNKIYWQKRIRSGSADERLSKALWRRDNFKPEPTLYGEQHGL